MNFKKLNATRITLLVALVINLCVEGQTLQKSSQELVKVEKHSSFHSKINSTDEADQEFLRVQSEALQGNAVAQYRLGFCYLDGTMVAMNQNEAFDWFKKAADQDHAAASYSVAICYYKGTGVSKNDN